MACCTTLVKFSVFLLGRSCRFELENDPVCFLHTQDSTSFWFRRQGPTPDSNTGPAAAHEGQYYFYFEASGRNTGGFYYFFDNGVLFENKTHCLSMYYHMKGSDMGTFSIYTYKSNYQQHFTVSGPQGDSWHKLDLNVPLDQQTYIVIVAVRGSSHLSDIAIDDVVLMPNVCPP